MENSHATHQARRKHGLLARMAVVASVLLLLLFLAMLWRQWSRVTEPTTAVVVNGDRSLDGTKIVVTPLDNDTESKPITVILSHDNAYSTAIYRYPGRYHVSITVPGFGRPLYDGDITIERLRGILIELPTMVTVIGDPSMTGDEVAVTSLEGKTETQTFSRENNYRLRFILMTAKYTMMVTRQGNLLLTDTITVEQHTPQQIDLRRPQ